MVAKLYMLNDNFVIIDMNHPQSEDRTMFDPCVSLLLNVCFRCLQNGLNALHLASKEGHVNVVTELLKRGANVDAATKVSPLSHHSRHGFET